MTLADLEPRHTYADLAERYGVSQATLVREVAAGRLKGKRMGRYIKFTDQQVIAWLEAKDVQAQTKVASKRKGGAKKPVKRRTRKIDADIAAGLLCPPSDAFKRGK